MKAWRDLSQVPMPDSIAALPRDERGYPIPFNVVVDANGKPDFRIIDENKAATAMLTGRCALCGGDLIGNAAFVGGPRSINAHLFADGPMHPECAEYAVQVCPMIAAPKFSYTEKTAPDGYEIANIREVSTQRPEVFGIGITGSYGFNRTPDDNVVIRAGAWIEAPRWFKHGQEVEAPQAIP